MVSKAAALAQISLRFAFNQNVIDDDDDGTGGDVGHDSRRKNEFVSTSCDGPVARRHAGTHRMSFDNLER